MREVRDIVDACWPLMDGFGPLHVIVEDGNLDDENIRRCMEDPDATAEEVAFCKALLTLSESDREASWRVWTPCFDE